VRRSPVRRGVSVHVPQRLKLAEPPPRSPHAHVPVGPSEEAPCHLLGGHDPMPADSRKHRSISWGHQDATPYHQSSKFLSLQCSVSQPDVPEEPMSNRPNRLLLNCLSLHTHHDHDRSAATARQRPVQVHLQGVHSP
jgi:hypothetical protein